MIALNSKVESHSETLDRLDAIDKVFIENQVPDTAPTATPKLTITPIVAPTTTPKPTVIPTVAPTATPKPTIAPTVVPTATPKPTVIPTVAPTATPKTVNIVGTAEYSVINRTIKSSLGRISNKKTVLIENNVFKGGECTAIQIDPCSVEKVIIRNNRFEDWRLCSSEDGDNTIIFIGWMVKQTACKAQILVENNTFKNTAYKWSIETKTSNVIVRGNSGNGSINLRHGRGVTLEANNMKTAYYIMGADHKVNYNKGGIIYLMGGSLTQAEAEAQGGGTILYPAAQNIRLKGNQSQIKESCWGSCPIKPTYKIE